MWIIDRSILIVQKKAPFLTWLNGLPDPEKQVTLAEINQQPSCYLLPPFEEEAEAWEALAEISEEIFCEEMEAWDTDENNWEKDRSMEKFKEWFDFKFCSMPVDLVEGDVEKEEY
jgi:hypothetical protein